MDPSFLLNSPNATSNEIKAFGVGGFYSVTSIFHDIEPGKFSTKISLILEHTNDSRTISSSGDAKTDAISRTAQERKEQIAKIADGRQNEGTPLPPPINSNLA
jgi:hypothetical protein